MKKLVVLLMAMVVATSAFAIVDDGTSSFGIYFDTEADMPVLEGATPYSTHTAFFHVINPVGDNIYGFELGYDLVGPAQILSTTFLNPQALNVGSPDNMIVGFGTPTETSPITTLATIDILYMSTDGEAVQFFLHGTTPSSVNELYPTILGADSALIQGELNVVAGEGSGGLNFVSGGIDLPIATESMSFDNVKSLYR